VALDVYIKSLDDSMRAARADYDKAFDNGDREALFQATTRIADIVAEKKAAEREKRALPTKGSSGGEPSQPTRTTTDQPTPSRQTQPTAGKPSPLALAWYENNKEWFGKDGVMTMGARVIDQVMVQEGYSPDDPDYYDELDKRLRSEFPHKFSAPAAKKASNQPVIRQSSTPASTSGKVKVTITAEDRRMAEQMGIPIENYARQKLRREQAANNPNGYVEII